MDNSEFQEFLQNIFDESALSIVLGDESVPMPEPTLKDCINMEWPW